MPPNPKCPSEAKNKVSLLKNKKGEISSFGVLIGAPIFFDSDQVPSAFRTAYQISLPPKPPLLSEEKNNIRPSAESEGWESQNEEFIFVPMLLGDCHSPSTFSTL